MSKTSPIVPGGWICRACDCVVQKVVFAADTGELGDDTRLARVRCQNDGQVMDQLTEADQKRLGFEHVEPADHDMPWAMSRALSLALGLT